MKAKLPTESLLFNQSSEYDYIDSFVTALTRSDVETWELAAALFHSAPSWFDALAKLRDKMVAVFGLKVSQGNPKLAVPPFHQGQQLGFFRVLQQSDREIILGDDDKHLIFRTSLMVSPLELGSQLRVSTVVCTKNRLGRLYFAVVKHFHRFIVPIMTRGMARIIDDKALPPHFYESVALSNGMDY